MTPFRKKEFEFVQIPHKYHKYSAPLLVMSNNKKIKETADTFKSKAIEYVPVSLRENTMKIANIATFRDRVKEHINKYEAKTQGIIYQKF